MVELKVRISGDAGDLESTIKDVERELSRLQGKEKTSMPGVSGKVRDWKKLGGSIREVGDSIDTATKPLQKLALVTAAGGVAAAKFAVDFEDNFAAVKKTVEGTPEQLEKVKQGIIDLSTVGIDGRSAIPQTTAELTALAAAGGQLGIETDNIVQFTETMAQLGAATNLVGEQGAQTLARFMNVAGVSQDKISNLGSSIVDLGNNFATTEAEIADMAMNLGATGKTVGISAQDILAYSTALSSMGVEAEAGGSAVSRIWIELQTAVSTGNKNLEAFARLSGKSAEEFKKQWGTDASGAFQDFLKGLNESEDQIAVLNNLGFNNIRDIQALQRLAGEEGFGLLTEAIERSNRAWMENTALQREFDAKAATTVSQIQLMKNNLVEAGRSIGETFLPNIANATTGIKNFAQKIAQMDDGQKQALITTGKWVIGLGAASKGISGTIKGVGNFIEATGKIKGAFAAGGALAKFAPALTGITAAAGQAAAAVGIVAAAVGLGSAAYNQWYKSQYRWTDGLSKSNAEIRKSMEELRELDAIQSDIKAQKLIIENPQSSQEQVDSAKAKIEEIKKLLAEEYQLHIKSDNSNLENAVERLKSISKNDVQIKINAQNSKLLDLQEKYEKFNEKSAELQQNLDASLADQSKYSGLQLAISDLNSAYEAGNITLKERNDAVKQLALEMGFSEEAARSYGEVERSANAGYAEATKQVDKYKEKLDSLKGSYEEYRAISTEIANWQTELLGIGAKEGDAEYVNQTLKQMGETIKRAGLDLNGYAIAAAQAMNGVNNLSDAWKQAQNGDATALNGIVNDYIRASTEFGASAQQTAVGAALLKKGFKSIGDAAKSGNLEAVTEQANQLADEMDSLEGKRIEISAEGDVSLIDEANEKVVALQKNGNVGVQVEANGDITILDESGNKVNYLQGVGAVAIQVNANGDIDILNEANEVIGVIPKEVEEAVNVKFNPETGKIETYKPDDKDAKVVYGVDETKVARWTPPQKEGVVHYKAVVDGGPLARGTQDFPGGLAVINDQRGVSDPRELVEFGGKGYIFDGRDVVLPLPKGAKVWTASQTKAIMAGRGIPHYAKGKNNEAWDAAQEDWRHYIKINNVSAAEELAHWDEMLKKFANDAEVIKEIQEEIVDSTKKMWNETLDMMEFHFDMGWMSTEEYYRQLAEYRDANFAPDTKEWRDATLELRRYNRELNKEKNEESMDWIAHMGNTNNWAETGDSMSAAYARVMERNAQDLAQGVIAFKDYEKTGNEAFAALLDGYTSYANNWANRQKEYFGMTAKESLAATERMIEETQALYDSLETPTIEQTDAYNAKMTELGNQKMDNQRSIADEYLQDVEWYRKQASVYGWEFMNPGDSEIATLKRAQANLRELYKKADPTDQKEILRQIDEYDLEIFQLQQDSVDEFFSTARDAINDAREEFNKQEEALRESWEVADRSEDKADIKAQLDRYKFAVTKEGKERYASLQEQMKQLERDEEMYQLQKKNNAVIEQMEADLEAAEADKKKILEELQKGTIDVNAMLNQINDTSRENGIGGVLNSILKKVSELEVISNNTFTQNNYNQVPDVTTATAFGNAAGRSFQYDSYGG